MITEDKELLALQKKLNTDAENPVDMFNLFDQAYNTGVDHCIEVVKGFKLPEGWTYLPDLKSLINIQLEQLKKPIQ